MLLFNIIAHSWIRKFTEKEQIVLIFIKSPLLPPALSSRKTLHSQQLFKKLVSFVMSYSFTDDEEPDILQQTMMVPFVDLLNHHSNHHAELNFHEEYLELVAVRDIARVGSLDWILSSRREVM